jgi:hypothetical protein
MSQLIAERSADTGSDGVGHFVSVFGGDQDIAAIAAALIENQALNASGPNFSSVRLRLGESPQVFRGAVSVPGRRRTVKHLVAVSAELAATHSGCEVNADRTVLCSAEPTFLLPRLADRFGLPALPEWSGWFAEELERRRAIHPLLGFGCEPVLVTANKKRLLSWIGAGLKHRRITIPETDTLPL